METGQTGVFSMDVVHKILSATSLEEAKELATQAVKDYDRKVKKDNLLKASKMIGKSKDQKDLAFGMSNFILAFQGEKVIK